MSSAPASAPTKPKSRRSTAKPTRSTRISSLPSNPGCHPPPGSPSASTVWSCSPPAPTTSKTCCGRLCVDSPGSRRERRRTGLSQVESERRQGLERDEELLPTRFEHDRLERDPRRVAAEFARQRLRQRVN